MPDIDLGTLHNQLAANAGRRGALKDRYDAIMDEAQSLGHEVVVGGSVQDMRLRLQSPPNGFDTATQAIAAARAIGWNAELEALSAPYELALMEARAINAEIALQERGGRL